MRSRWVTCLFVSLTCAIVAAETNADDLTFAGIPWRADRAIVTRSLSAKGFSLGKVDAAGDLVFVGELNDQRALVVAWMAEEGLAKITVRLLTSEEDARKVYADTKRLLRRMHGEPETEVESYQYPFNDGQHVGYENTAIRIGKGALAAFWKRGAAELYVKITTELKVDIAYESPFWPSEYERRKRREVAFSRE
jgi:hypothetical protein